ncbi:MAG: monovalent cation/H+ antiporter complex subunit F [Pseudomonadota bacterium]
MSILGATIGGPLLWGAAIGGLFTVAGILLTVYRLVVGPTLPDRVVALDMLTVLLMALLMIFAVAVEVPSYLDAALALALVAFLATVAFARYIERRDPLPEQEPYDQAVEQGPEDAPHD